MLRTVGLIGVSALVLAGCGKPDSKPLSLRPLPDLTSASELKPASEVPTEDLSFERDSVRAGPFPAGEGADVRIVYTGRSLDDVSGPCRAEDELALVVRQQGREVDRKVYCSSYGRAELDLQKDVRGAHFAVLTVGEGRGTGVTDHWMVAYQITPKLVQRTRALIYHPTPVGTGWEYKTVRIERPAFGGLRYHMKRSLHGEPDEYEVPPPETKTVTVAPG